MSVVDTPAYPAHPAETGSAPARPQHGPARLWSAAATIFSPAAERSGSRLGGHGDASRPAWFGPGLAVVAALVGTVVSLLRQPGVSALNSVWAEDGSVFLTDAATKGTLDALTTPYAGYFHLVPRVLAEITVLFPAGAAATVMAVLAALVTSLMAVTVYVASGAHLSAPLARFLVSAVVVVLPLGQQELGNSLANLHWPGLYLVFWMLIWTPASRTGRIVAAVAVFAIAASDILVLVFLPLALLRAVRRRRGTGREGHALVLAGLLGAGLAIQLLGVLTGDGGRELSPDPVQAVSGYVLRAVPPALLGERWIGGDVSFGLAAVAWLLVLAAVVVAWRRLTRPQWTLAVFAAGHSAALYALPVVLSGVGTARYAAAPAMLLITALAALLLPGRDTPRADTARHAPLWGLAVLLAVVCVVNLRVDNRRGEGPKWSDGLVTARQECAAGATEVGILISPREDPAWQARITCDYVGGTQP